MTNIAKLLKDAPNDMKLYSPLFGEVTFKYINNSKFGVVVEDSEGCCRSFDKYGRYFTVYNNAECLLFPSKDYRTWQGWTPSVKSNFKIGDWITDGNITIQIEDIRNNSYTYSNGVLYSTRIADKVYHLWSIADAKNGDILVSGLGNPFIYDGNIEFSSAGAYVGVSRDGRIRFDMFPSKAWASIKDVKPATNEQRVLLFKKIQEAGYQWYAGNKELKKIQSHYDISNFHAGMPVLIRDRDNEEWTYALFSHYKSNRGDYKFSVTGSISRQCIPFEGNEKLLGTTDMPSEEFINW